MRPCNPPNNAILTRTLFLPGGEVFNEAEPCNIPAKAPAKTKTQTQHVEKDCIDGLRHSTIPKSPREAAQTTLACDTPRKSLLRVCNTQLWNMREIIKLYVMPTYLHELLGDMFKINYTSLKGASCWSFLLPVHLNINNNSNTTNQKFNDKEIEMKPK
jgi:hypothetical protein